MRASVKIVSLALLVGLVAGCSPEAPSAGKAGVAGSTVVATDYERALGATKALYPFKKPGWRSAGRFAAIFDTLIGELGAAGERAPETQKRAAFRRAVASLNELHRRDASLIETGEAEQLCVLLAQVGIAAGMPPAKFPDEEGAASGRDW